MKGNLLMDMVVKGRIIQCIENIMLPEARNKISLARSGDKNLNWKGDKVGMGALHTYMRKFIIKSELCEFCKQRAPYDIACVTLQYSRDPINWRWLCRSCHFKYDYMIGVRIRPSGNKNGFYGKLHTAETIEKMRLDKLGKRPSEETKQRLRKLI